MRLRRVCAGLHDRPGLLLGAMAIEAASIFYQRGRSRGRFECHLEECRAAIDRRHANEIGLPARLDDGLTKRPAIRFNASLRAIGQLFKGCGKGTGLAWHGGAHLSQRAGAACEAA